MPSHKTSNPEPVGGNKAEDGAASHKRKDQQPHVAQDATAPEHDLPEHRAEEHGGQKGLEPTRFGDWEKKGRCTDF